MDATKRKKLEAAGFRVGDAEDFLGLTPEEREFVDLRVKLSRLIRLMREKLKLTQKELATRIKSSQSRVAKLEGGAGDVSLDLMFRGLFAVGGKLADMIGTGKRKKTARGKAVGTSAKRTPGAREVVSEVLIEEV
ncbi:MAG: transcriptional regulator [Isosphaera sp.]|nr:transcriptional regulator [Isosphaera sp.]